MLLTLFLVATITFFLMKLMPGTPYSNQEKMTAAQIQIMNEQYGLNKPVWQQYLIYIADMLHGDLGTSFQYSNQPVTYLISSRIGPSAQLGLQAMIFGLVFGIIIGSIAAINHNTWIDTTATVVSIIGKSVPNFVLAVLLQYYIALKLGWFPIADWLLLHHLADDCFGGRTPSGNGPVYSNRDGRCFELWLYRTCPG